jgi:primosomal protein DnaI
MREVGKEFAKYLNRNHLQTDYDNILRKVQNDPDVQLFLRDNRSKLAPDAVEKGAAKLYEFVNEKEKLVTHKSTFAPGYHPQLLVNNHLIDVSYEPLPEKVAADEAAAKDALVNASRMPKDFKDARLDSYDKAGRDVALREAFHFINAYRTNPKEFHPGLYLYGNYGVGKTYLLGAIANDLADDEIPTLILHVPTFSVEIRDAISDNSVLQRIRRIESVPILMFDDIGGETLSPWFRDDVLGVILQYRMQERLATFFSSNLSMKNLQEFMAAGRNGQDDSLKANRIMARIKFLAKEVNIEGPDRRQQIVGRTVNLKVHER